MRVLAAAVRAFFAESPALVTFHQLRRRFSTVADVLRGRFDTEEKAVLPLFAKCQNALT